MCEYCDLFPRDFENKDSVFEGFFSAALIEAAVLQANAPKQLEKQKEDDEANVSNKQQQQQNKGDDSGGR
jgi:thioredoxin-related protein